jgi:hypothetical protein
MRQAVSSRHVCTLKRPKEILARLSCFGHSFAGQ